MWESIRISFTSLWRFNKHSRPWQLPFFAAIATGLPLFISTYLGDIHFAILATLASSTCFLYIPHTPMAHRYSTMMCVTAGMTLAFVLGLIGALHPSLAITAIFLTAFFSTFLTRLFVLKGPMGMFFVMTTAIAISMPIDKTLIFHRIGMFFVGAIGASLLALFYSLYILTKKSSLLEKPVIASNFQLVVIDSVFIAIFTTLSAVVGMLAGLSSWYWINVSCMVVIQTVTTFELWTKQLQRLFGTFLGLGLAWLILHYLQNPWHIVLAMTVLPFFIEILVVRNYAFAVIFVTPFTITMAEVAVPQNFLSNDMLILMRLVDTVTGCAIGFIGGYVMHQKTVREIMTRCLTVLISRRLWQNIR